MRKPFVRAFVLYSKDEIQFRQLLDKLKNYGTPNCNMQQFIYIYKQWHMEAFPGCKLDSGAAAMFREDWFNSFLQFLCNYQIQEDWVPYDANIGESKRLNGLRKLLRRIFK